MDLKEKDKQFREAVFSMPFPDIQEEFYLYWSEPNKSGTKLRYELEKTWDLNRRLRRWQLIKDSRREFGAVRIAKVEKVLTKKPENEFERLEQFFHIYTLRPTEMPFENFGDYFDFMKDNGLLKDLSDEEKSYMKQAYGNNGKALRCAWVNKSLDAFMYIGSIPKPRLTT